MKCVQGLQLVCVKDKNTNMYPIPSHKNYFGPIKVSNIIVDSGCQDHLIGVTSMEMLDQIFDQLPRDQYGFTVSKSHGTTGVISIIVGEPLLRTTPIPVKIGEDLFDTANATIGKIRFGISSLHAKAILENEQRIGRFFRNDIAIASLQTLAQLNIPQLPVSLLGNAIADQFDEIKCGDVRFYVKYNLLESTFFSSLPTLSFSMRHALTPDKETREALNAYASDKFPAWSEEAEFDF